MSLKSLIREVGADKPVEELVSVLNTASIVVADPQLYTWAGIGLIAGPQGAEAFRVALEQNGLGWVVHQLGGSGIQLSNPLCQFALSGLAQAGVPGAAELALAGIHNVSPYVNAGFQGLVTEQQVRAALLEIRKDDLIEDRRDAFEQYRVDILQWDGSGNPPVMRM